MGKPLSDFFHLNTNESFVRGESASACSAPAVLETKDDGSKNTAADDDENSINFSIVDDLASGEETSESPSDERNEVEGWYKKNKSQLAAGSEQMFICFERQIWRSNKTICDLFSVCFSRRTY